jgi:hypothetical protein
MISFLRPAKVGLEPAGFIPHQIAHQQAQDEPNDQGKRNLWHDLSFGMGQVL